MRWEGPPEQARTLGRQGTRTGESGGAHLLHGAARKHSLRRDAAVETQLGPILLVQPLVVQNLRLHRIQRG